jgi:hypothetical protein
MAVGCSWDSATVDSDAARYEFLGKKENCLMYQICANWLAVTWDTSNINTKINLRKWRNRRHRRAGRGAVYCGEPAASIFVVCPVNAAGFSETSINFYR